MAVEGNNGQSVQQPRHFLVLGTAGAGITSALEFFSEFGFLQVGQVPPQRLEPLVEALTNTYDAVAFGLGATHQDEPARADTLQAIERLMDTVPGLNLLVLDAPQEVLIQRYQQSGKRHPLDRQGLATAIAEDKLRTAGFATLKRRFQGRYYAVDTGTTTFEELRNKVARILGVAVDPGTFTVTITSFGFKHGAPRDAELLFDMRFIHNPFYEEALRPLSGLDQPVVDYIFGFAHARAFFDRWAELVATTLPHYQAEGKTRLSIAVGCTGGQHRSVCMSEALARYLQQAFPSYNIVVVHREMADWSRTSRPEICSA